jgi:hypothetical protein
MQALRRAHLLTRLVLVWFALALGAAIASPIVKPQSIEMVCSASGAMKLLIIGDDGAQELSGYTLDCPLCMTSSAPPPVLHFNAEPAHALAYVLRSIPAARLAAATAPPLPARGPPSLS